jgi:hypothetical protein
MWVTMLAMFLLTTHVGCYVGNFYLTFNYQHGRAFHIRDVDINYHNRVIESQDIPLQILFYALNVVKYQCLRCS